MPDTDFPALRPGSPLAGSDPVRVVVVGEASSLADVDPLLARRAGFTASRGQVWVLPDQSGTRVLVGIGADASPENVVRAIAKAAPAWADAAAVSIELPAEVESGIDPGHLARLVGSAVTFGATRAGIALPSAVHLTGDAGAQSEAFTSGALLGLARARAAELVDRPPNQLTPATFAAQAREWAVEAGARCHVIETDGLLELGAGGLLAIGSGSANPPALVHVSSGPESARPDVVLVGKGITFDSGGLSLKPSEAMATMKYDMAGAAAVLATALLAAKLYPHLRVDAVCALAENLPSGTSCRPGDVVRTISGRKVEILDTDFEGRVVLADALGYAMTLKPARVVDVATLTVASMFALGMEIGALFSHDDAFAEQLLYVATQAGEPLWRLPLDRRYDDQLSSDLADIRNFPAHPYGRAITAAAFLSRFVDAGVPWAHLDIAGPAWSQAGAGRRGGTGFGVATLTHLLDSLAGQQRQADEPIEKVATT
jgi:leucyl aminopeptidase